MGWILIPQSSGSIQKSRSGYWLRYIVGAVMAWSLSFFVVPHSMALSINRVFIGGMT